MNTPPRKILLTKQLEERTGLKAKTWKRWRHEGIGPEYVVLSTRRIGYYEDVIETWLAERRARNAIEAHEIRKRVISSPEKKGDCHE